MTREAAPPVVRLTRLLAAPPERVFAAWLDPAGMARWLSPIGRAEAEVDARVGGRLRVTMIGEGARIVHTGEYLEIDPPRRLVFSWQSPYTGPGSSLVTVELVRVEAGTELRLAHERLPADQVAPHGGGWSRILDRLAAELGAGARGGS